MKVVHLGILFIANDHPEPVIAENPPARWVLDLALAQKEHGEIDPEIVVQVPGSKRDFETMVEGIRVHYLAAPHRLRALTGFRFDAARIAKKLRKIGPDLVHAHGTEDAYGLAAQRSGFPYVVTAQGLLFLMNAVLGAPSFSRERLVERAERRCLRRCRDVIAKSDHVAIKLRDHFPHLTLHRIPNTFDPRILDVAWEKKEPDLVAFVGGIIPRKGVHLIGDAARILREKGISFRLDVYGDGQKYAGEYEREQMDQLRDVLGRGVTFHGVLPRLEVAKGVAKASALLAPSQEEMFGNQLIESLVVGTHGIVTEGTGMEENVRRFGNGTVVAQRDAKNLAAAMERILRNSWDAAAAGEARAKVIAAMGPERVGKQHIELYNEILGRVNPVA